MLVGNNIALVVFTSLMTILLESYIDKTSMGHFLFLLLSTIIITIIVLIFGEFLPKTLFRLFADDALYFFAYPIKFFQYLLSLPSWMMTKLSNALLRIITKNPIEKVETAFTRLDLQEFINETRTESEEEIDKELFGKALHLKNTRIRECMIPRPEIEYIDVTAKVEDLEQLIKDTKLSRIIVIKDDIDNVLGYVHHQQLLQQPKNIKGLILDIPFVPEAMYASELLNKFIKERMSIACVVDEFGGLAGIVTLEDIVEEIFGEIEDEHDQEEYVETQISEEEYIFSGRLEISYLNEKYEHLNFPEGDYHTLSGYLVMTTEKIPDQGREIELNGYRFILELVSDTKIETVRVIKLQEEESDETD